MAGHKAAASAPTWPTINGEWLPYSLFDNDPVLQLLVGNKIAVQFIHRGLAYLILLMVSVWTVKAYRLKSVPGYFESTRWFPLSLVVVQITLGIMSLLFSPGIVPNHWVAFDWMAQLHQVVGLLFLLTMIGMLYLVNRPRPVRLVLGDADGNP